MDQMRVPVRAPVKVTIHITHSETDDLAEVEAAARRLGLTVTQRGGFMGVHHTELGAVMTASTLAGLLNDEAAVEAVAA